MARRHVTSRKGKARGTIRRTRKNVMTGGTTFWKRFRGKSPKSESSGNPFNGPVKRMKDVVEAAQAQVGKGPLEVQSMAGPSDNTVISFEPNKQPETKITFSSEQAMQPIIQPNAPVLEPTQTKTKPMKGPTRNQIANLFARLHNPESVSNVFTKTAMTRVGGPRKQ